MKPILLAALMALLAASVGAEEVLSCKDTDVTGFSWESGVPQRSDFDPIRFTVMVVTPSRRVIKFAVYPREIIYDCFSPIKDKDLSFCTSTLVKAVEPIIFRGNKFERVVNFTKYISGQSIGLAVAYGTCTKFKAN